ncbi:MAG: HD domain-containing protein [bacterium]|nr:HD domain-containing protein [bacterium]
MKKNGSSLERMLQFVTMMHSFQQIRRKVRATGEHRWENDAEHSYQLAMVCWYIIDSEQLDLDFSKAMLYAMVHDIPEIYAGDPCIFTDGPEALVGKEKRERKAMARLAKEFREFTGLHEALVAYNKRQDRESRFVYAMDKILPFYNIVLDDGKTWKQFNTSLDEVLAAKENKIRICPVASQKLDEILVEMRQHQGELFSKSTTPFPEDEVVAPASEWGQ